MMNQQLVKLERAYLQALSLHGIESQTVINSAVQLMNKLIEEGGTFHQAGNLSFAEHFYMRAKDISGPLQQSNIQSAEFLLARGESLLRLAQILEKSQQYLKAYMLLKECLPTLDRYDTFQRRKFDQQVRELHAKVLFHLTENAYIMKKKPEAVQYGQKCIEIFRYSGIQTEPLLELPEQQVKNLLERNRKEFIMLSRVNFVVGKHQFKVDLDKAALIHLTHASFLANHILGTESIIAQKYLSKLTAVKQKLEFQKAIHGDIKNFKKFEEGVELQKSEVHQKQKTFQIRTQDFRKSMPAGINKIAPVPQSEPEHQRPTTSNKRQMILRPKKSSPPQQTYQTLMNQMNTKISKFHLPEYVKKVREQYEEKLMSTSDAYKYLENDRMFASPPNPQPFIIKSPSTKITRPNSSSTKVPQNNRTINTDLVDLFSQRSWIKSNRPSGHRPQTAKILPQPKINDNLIIDTLHAQLRDLENVNTILPKYTLNQRPQFYSGHNLLKTDAKTKPDSSRTTLQQRQSPQIGAMTQEQKNASLSKSHKLIEKQEDFELTQIHEENSQVVTIRQPTLNKLDSNENFVHDSQNKFERSQNVHKSKTDQSLQINQPQVTQSSQDPQEKWIDFYLRQYTMEELEKAANKITALFLLFKATKMKRTSKPNLVIKRLQSSSGRAKSGQSQQTSKSSVFQEENLHPAVNKISPGGSKMMKSTTTFLVPDEHKKQRGSNQQGFGFTGLLKEIKSTENEQSTNRQKRVAQFFTEIVSLPSNTVSLMMQNFFDLKQSLWTIHSASFKLFCPLQLSRVMSQSAEDEVVFESRVNMEDQKYSFAYLNKILSHNIASKALCVIACVQFGNHQFSGQLQFKIQNFVMHFDDLTDLQFQDNLQLFDHLLVIYLRQKGIYNFWSQQYLEINQQRLLFAQNDYHELVDRLLFMMKHHIKYMRNTTGDCLINVMDVNEDKIQKRLTIAESALKFDGFYQNREILEQRRQINKKSLIQLEDIKRAQLGHFRSLNLNLNSQYKRDLKIDLLSPRYDQGPQTLSSDESRRKSISSHHKAFTLQNMSSQGQSPAFKQSQQQQPQSRLTLQSISFNSKLLDLSSDSPQINNNDKEADSVLESNDSPQRLISRKQTMKISDNQYYVSAEEQEYLKTYFPEFQLATKSKIDAFQIREVEFEPQHFKSKTYYITDYFAPQPYQMKLQPLIYRDPLPRSMIIHSQILKYQGDYYHCWIVLQSPQKKIEKIARFGGSSVAFKPVIIENRIDQEGKSKPLSMMQSRENQSRDNYDQIPNPMNNFQSNSLQEESPDAPTIRTDTLTQEGVEQDEIFDEEKLNTLQTILHLQQMRLKNVWTDKVDIPLKYLLESSQQVHKEAIESLIHRLCCHGRLPPIIQEQFLKAVPQMIHIEDCKLKIEFKQRVQTKKKKTHCKFPRIVEDFDQHNEHLSEPYNAVGQNIHLFHDYKSQFVLSSNKYFNTFKISVNGNQNTYYQKIEFVQKYLKVKLTSMSALNEQIYRANLQNLRQNLYQLIQSGQVYAKITIFDLNKRSYDYRELHKLHQLEKVAHLIDEAPMKGKILMSSTQMKRKFIGRVMDFDTYSTTDVVAQNQRLHEKSNQLDLFLLRYIQDHFGLTAFDPAEQLRQTLLYHYFKQQLKLTIISSNMLEDVRSQKFFMRTYFLSKQCYQYSKLKNMGAVLVQTQVFKFNPLYSETDEKYVFFYLLISAQESKTKSFKLILDLSDVRNLIWDRVNDVNCFDDVILHETVRKIMNALVCYTKNTYRGIKIPLSLLSQNREKQKYDLMNQFGETTTGGDLFKDDLKDNQRTRRPSILSKLSQPSHQNSIQSAVQKLQQNKLIDKMVLELNAFPQEVINVLSKNTMLTPIYKGVKTIYKQTLKIDGQYLILTISHQSQLQFYSLHFYVPKTSRCFICFLHPSDFWFMNPSFLESIFPSKICVQSELVDQLFEQKLRFQEFKQIYELIYQDEQEQDIPRPQFNESAYSEAGSSRPEHEDSNYTSNVLQRMIPSRPSLSHIESGKNSLHQSFSRTRTRQKSKVFNQVSQKMIESKKNHNSSKRSILQNQSPGVSDVSIEQAAQSFIEEEGSMYQKDKMLFYETLLNRKNNLEIINNFEIKLWEQILSNVRLIKNDQGKYVVEIDNYRGVLREILQDKILHLGQEENVSLEIYVENAMQEQNLFSQFESLKLRDSSIYYMYIRINFYNHVRIHNDKIMLRQLLYNYYHEENYNLQNLSKKRDSDINTYEFNLADIHRLSVFVMNKIRKNFTKQTLHTLSNQYNSDSTRIAALQFHQVDEFYEDDKCPQVMKINIEKTIETILSTKAYQYILLHRGVFTLRPKQMVALFYRAHNKSFYAFLWNTSNGNSCTKKLSMRKVEQKIPHVQNLLQLQLYLEIGKRILLAFKNTLMIQTFFVLNNEEALQNDY